LDGLLFLGWEVTEFGDGKVAAPAVFLLQFSRVAALPAQVTDTALTWTLAIFPVVMCLNISGWFWI